MPDTLDIKPAPRIFRHAITTVVRGVTKQTTVTAYHSAGTEHTVGVFPSVEASESAAKLWKDTYLLKE